jgi:hypothetical protein
MAKKANLQAAGIEPPEPWPRETGEEKSKSSKTPPTIRVRIRRAHKIITDPAGGGYRRLDVGDEIEISEEEFLDCLHVKLD